jgi:HAD superfamily hydrolase (TIGR01450 family)
VKLGQGSGLQPAADRAWSRSRPPRLFAGYVVDLDGTVYLGDEPVSGAVETLARIRDAGSRLVFLTNSTLRSAASNAARLRGFGVRADEREVVTPLAVLVDYLTVQHSGAAVLTVAEPLVDQTLLAAGIPVTADPATAGVVVVSFDRTFDYSKLVRAFRAVRRHGAVVVATNPDSFCPTPDGGVPDCAAMLAAVEACTGVRAEAVLGKPGPQMAAAVLARLGVPAGEAAMIGDSLLSDVAMGRTLRMTSILVLSGVTTVTDLAASDVRPDYVIDGLGELLPRPSRTPSPASQPAVPREAK